MLIPRALRRISPHLPGSWELPVRATADIWDDVESEVRHLKEIGPCSGIALDVGANYGLYSFALARHYSSVISFEPNVLASQPLRAWRNERVVLHAIALSDCAEMAPLHIPLVNGKELAGWASLGQPRIDSLHEVHRIMVRKRTLDSFELNNVGFIKIDVEGHELRVIRGATETIHRCRPNILVELTDGGVENALRKMGYRRHSLPDLIGTAGSQQNAIFLPGERQLRAYYLDLS
jgi:FkbM family methyltransferase